MNPGTAASSVPVRCASCGLTLGVRTVDAVVIRHRMREIVAVSVVAIRCERCGTLTPPIRGTGATTEPTK